MDKTTLTITAGAMRAVVPTTYAELKELAAEYGRDAWMVLLDRAQHEKRAIKYEHGGGAGK